MLLIGSRALKIVNPALLQREPFDYDFIMTFDEFKQFVGKHKNIIKHISYTKETHYILQTDVGIIEINIALPDTSGAKLMGRCTNSQEILGDLCLIPSLNMLYELKLSHRYLKNSSHFLKTMRDIRAMREAGAVVEDAECLKLREEETYTYAHPKLNQDKKDFFSGDGLKYVYDHDTIHLSVRHLEQPAYTYFKEPDKEVMCSKKLFWDADDQTRLYSVLEEAYVLALERSQIPHHGKITPRKSFEIALMKVCTSITSGWWREFAWENYNKVDAMYSDTYADKFWTGVASGLVKPHKEKNE